MHNKLSALLVAMVAAGQLSTQATPSAPEKVADGIVVPLPATFLKVEVYADNVVRIACAKDRAFFNRQSVVTEPKRVVKTDWSLKTENGEAILATARLQVHVNLDTGAVSFFDANGKAILAETPDGRTITPAEVQGVQTFYVGQQWEPNAGESLYGLGQRQIGVLDIKGYDLDLWQHNTHVVVPLLVSSRGYGVLWDNLSYTRFGDLREFEPIPPDCLMDASNQPGGLTTGTFTPDQPDQLEDVHTTNEITFASHDRDGARGWTRWEGEIVAPTNGDYQLKTYSNGRIKVWLDGKVVIDHWRQNWLTAEDQIKVRLEAGHHYPIRIESGGDQRSTMELTWKTPDPNENTSLWSQVGGGVDYYFIYGPALDQVVAGFRSLTGQAPMMPEWAFGLWQSRQRYETSTQSLEVVKEYRQRAIPFDDIVQDWQYWPPDKWGSHLFDTNRFPDPVGWLKELHALHTHVMISVWGKFYTGTGNFDAMQKAGYLYQPNLKEGISDWIGYPYTFYDAFNPSARKLFWSQINTALFSKGIDAWWLDASEPDLTPSPPTLEGQLTHMNPTAMGPASKVLNGYPLMNSMAVYEGQREAAPNQRVFVLTRSGFAGSQRYAAATWSGDVTCTWTALRKQIPAGLGFCLSGIPYWTSDSGGYTMESRFSAENPKPADFQEWCELNARWFEFATFCPLTRLHGELKPREPWTFGGDSGPAYQTIVKFDNLRYRMLPYIYSVAGAVTLDGDTMMRPLVMDFRSDVKARDVTDEYMFGPAFLVAPVTTYEARSRSVYLPSTSGGWYDFWTGAPTAGGQTIDAAAPYDSMPLFIRAGAIIPFGPELQYTGEKPANPITLYVYAGADGNFTLYEDDGLTYNYEHGAFACIPIKWDNNSKTLTIGKREGKFHGMLTKRTFNVVLVAGDKPVGFSFTPKADQTVVYLGKEVKVKFK
ncbi:MAG: TIM-barrel domain-containing protein [Verrucomicrobiia bacterium]